ncbi:hypothetical protein AB0P12_27190 [Streptomyces subrutilus]|nr:hypothetical protein [Streptomyces subrutilus]QEU82699.1 hypothetical protein CP968_03905 [Streptomyces subrutilus]WSJ33364.1 hypothetical protein OG479_30935 [Streptomyces subrutilus]
MDARWRVYGGRDDVLDEQVPGHAYVDLVDGPLDGRLLDVTDWRDEDRAEGSLLVTDRGLYGVGGRAYYAPDDTHVRGPFRWRGDTP